MTDPVYTDIPSTAGVKASRALINQAFETVYASLTEKPTYRGVVADAASLANLVDAKVGDTAKTANDTLYFLAEAPATVAGNWKSLGHADPDLSGYVQLAATQTVTGSKDFTGGITKNGVAVPNTTEVNSAITSALNALAITGQYLGSSSTFAGLPTVDAGGQAAGNGDWAILTTDVIGTGSSGSPQYSKGIYVYNGSSFSLGMQLSASVDLSSYATTSYVNTAIANATPPLGSANNPVTSASATRPTGLAVVWWLCPTVPTNWTTNDVWFNNS